MLAGGTAAVIATDRGVTLTPAGNTFADVFVLRQNDGFLLPLTCWANLDGWPA